MAPLVDDEELLGRLVNHIFLPPQLPQRDDGADIDSELLRVTRQALQRFQNSLKNPTEVHHSIPGALSMLSNSETCHSLLDGTLNEAELADMLGRLVTGQSLALRIRAQNAGLFISKYDGHITFEAFELAPLNEAVMTTNGRLTRRFPGAAVSIDSSTFSRPEFQADIAQTLSTMSKQAAPDMQPMINKAGSMHEEERDTTHPGLVCELFVGSVLKALGSHKPHPVVDTITKSTRDDVLWENADLPWRRAPMWMLIRVALQLFFSRNLKTGANSIYKAFMAFMMAELLDTAGQLRVAVDLQYAMSCKVSRRLQKLGKGVPENVQKRLHNVLSSCNATISRIWRDVREAEPNPCRGLSQLAELQFNQDSIMVLPKVDQHIEARSARRTVGSKSGFSATSGLSHFTESAWPTLPKSSPKLYQMANLQEFEHWVALHLRKFSNAYGVNTYCSKLRELIDSYHALARKLYERDVDTAVSADRKGNPEAMSVMFLTILELWVSMDEKALDECPLLRDYDPGVPAALLQNLLLPSKEQMTRLRNVERYLQSRQHRAIHDTSVLFGSPRDVRSFATRWFDLYGKQTGLHDLLQQIQDRGERDRLHKLEELESQLRIYRGLKRRALEAEHTLVEVSKKSNFYPFATITRKVDDPEKCSKCIDEAKAEDMRIYVHEWPLPSNQNEAKAVVFELKIPSWYSAWRDCTLHILHDVLKFENLCERGPKKQFPLSEDPHVGKQYEAPDDEQRIMLLTMNKPHAFTHRQRIFLSKASEANVCKDNATKYLYFDQDTAKFLGGVAETQDAARSCTYQLPGRAAALDDCLFRPADRMDGPTPNTIIAKQSSSPKHMSMEEYKELCGLTFGHNIQWYNILLQLASPTVDFRKDESVLTFFQCILQAGPFWDESSVPSNVRPSHSVLQNAGFATRLLDNLHDALVRVKENWESISALSIFTAIACRLLALNDSTKTKEKCLLFLASVREVAHGWLQTLRQRAQCSTDHADHSQFLSKLIDVALVCGTTFDVDDAHLAKILGSERGSSILLQCSMAVAERERRTREEKLSPLLSWRFKRTLHRALPILADSHPGLDDAVQNVWSSYRSGYGWTSDPDDDQWLETETLSSPSVPSVAVRYNLLTGELLVDGFRLARPPKSYEKDEIYKALFGTTSVEVMPSKHSFSTKARYRGFDVHLGMTVNEDSQSQGLVIHAIGDMGTFEAVPQSLFRGALPEHFVRDFVHWYNPKDGTVLFRHMSDPWPSPTLDQWKLVPQVNSSGWRLRNNRRCLFGLSSNTSETISQMLSSLIERSRIHVVLRPDGKAVDIEIPSLQLSFFLESNTSSLESKEFRGMAVSHGQSLGTLIGLENKLLLRPRNAGAGLLLLPEGEVTYKKREGHIKVNVDLATVTRIHPYHVDDRLGRLVDNGSIQSKLYLAYLHALTAFTLPDPFTRRTGTEQALAILRSAAVRSFEQLTQDNIEMLSMVAELAPSRVYYPRDARVMQTVGWDEHLGFMAQHGDFHTAVWAILRQAERSRMFYPEQSLEFPSTEDVEEYLLLRDLHRTATFRVADFGAEHHAKAADVDYDARDQNQTSSRAVNAFAICSMLHRRSDKCVWKPPEEHYFWNKIKTLDVVHEAKRPLEEGLIRYDAALMQADSTAILVHLLPLHETLATEAGQVKEFAFMMWLATHAFSPSPDLPLLQTIVAFVTARDDVPSPPTTVSLSPALGLRPDRHSIKDIVKDAKHEFEHTPDFTAQPRKKKNRGGRDELETHGELEIRRQADYERHVDVAAQDLALNLHKQWPCETLEIPNCALRESCTDYIDVSKAMHAVSTLFKTLRGNNRLQRYLNTLELALAELEVEDSNISASSLWRLKPPLAKTTTPGFVSVDDIFLGFTPQVEALGKHPDFSLPPGEHRKDSAVGDGFQLQYLIDRLEATEDGTYEKKYVAALQESLKSLQIQDVNQPGLNVPTSSEDLLNLIKAHLAGCEFYLQRVYNALEGAVHSELRKRSGGHEGLQWPRVSPTLFLQQLSRGRWAKLSAKWQESMIKYGLAITAVQRAERLLNAAASANKDDLTREVQNPGHLNWDPRHCPEALLLEVEGGIMIRPVQQQIAAEMISPLSGGNQVVQLNMGEGKSSTIVPMTAVTLADGNLLVRVIVAKPQSKQMAEMLISKLGGLINRRICYMPFSRALKPSKASAEAVEELCKECMEEGSILLLQPEHILSFGLSGVESYTSGNAAAGEVLVRLQDFFDKSSRDIIDESDANFSVNFELIYTMGLRQSIDLGINRWTLIQQVLDLVKSHAPDLAKERPTEVEITYRQQGGFPRIRMLQSETAEVLVRRIAADICNNGLRGLPLVHQDQDFRDAILHYISETEVATSRIRMVEQSELWADYVYRSSLLLLRGLLAHGILEFALHSKRWRVNYGLTDRTPVTRLAAPYVAKDSPTPRSEFSHPDATIILTSLSYYYEGLKDEDLFAAFSRLMNSDQSECEYRIWIKDVDIPSGFRNLSRINLKDVEQCRAHVFPTLRFSKGAIDYFLSHIVFAKEMRQYPHKLSSSGCDLGKRKNQPTTGFSGTNDTRELLPLDVVQQDLPEQHHTNALVLEYLLQANNLVALMTPPENSASNDGERFLDFVMQLQHPAEVILDVGAQILELDNLGVAKAWLRKCRLRQEVVYRKKEAAVYCNDNDQLCVVDRYGRCELLLTSSFASRLDVCVIYLDEAHTRGIDLKLPPMYRAAVTLGPKVTNDRLKQACMRMRKLGKGQTVTFCVPNEIQTRIREAGKLGSEQHISVQDVLYWVITETFAEIRRSMSLWAVQNFNFSIQQQIWQRNVLQERHMMSKEAADEFLEPEARDLDYRYRPKPNKKSPLARLEARKEPRFQAIVKKCKDFGLFDFQSRKLTEEQERELSPEVDVDAERVVQKAAPAKPADHKLHEDLLEFVTTGIAKSKSKAYGPAFETLRNTSAGEIFDLSQLRGQYLMATADFAHTIMHPKKGSLSDSYQRSVQWILSSRDRATNRVSYLIIVSPFEANKLVEQVSGSQIATLHLYRPRYNITYPKLDKLDFCPIPLRVNAPEVPKELVTQLNVFAGQLYFSTYEDYIETCKFLGLSHTLVTDTMRKRGWKIASDGFIEQDDQGKPGGQASHVRSSPVQFLKVLLSTIRRNGEDICKTQMGGLLEDNNLLTPADFEEE